MEFVIKTANNNAARDMSYDALLAEVMRLNKENRQLRRDKQLLLDMLAEAVDNCEVIVVREDTLNRHRRFKIDENLGGEILVRIV